MNDRETTVETLKVLVKKFVDERDWNQFHSPKNLSERIMIEAAELLELFNWRDSAGSFEIVKERQQEVLHELADVLIAVCAFANACSIDIAQAVVDKVAVIKERYPVELCKSKSDKYTTYLQLRKKNK